MRLDWRHGWALARARPGLAVALILGLCAAAYLLWAVALRYYGEIWAIAVIGAGCAVFLFAFRADRDGEAFGPAVLLFGAIAGATILIPSALLGLVVALIAAEPAVPYAASALAALMLAAAFAVASVLVRV